MANYQATVASRRSATETFDYLATFSNAAEWDPGVGERAAAGLASALSTEPAPPGAS